MGISISTGDARVYDIGSKQFTCLLGGHSPYLKAARET
jgi:hypothetical protein